MKFHMLMLMNEWMMFVLVKCKCQIQCLTLRCYPANWFFDKIKQTTCVAETLQKQVVFTGSVLQRFYYCCGKIKF